MPTPVASTRRRPRARSVAADDASTASSAPAASGPLVLGPNTAAKNRPDFVRKEVARWRPARSIVRDFVAGTTAVHEQAETYLPKWPEEDPDLYTLRKSLAPSVYGATERAVIASIGMLTGRPAALAPESADVALDPTLVAHMKNVDGAGNDLGAFARALGRAQLIDGLGGILVDMAPNPTRRTADRSEQREGNVRPYWRVYDAEQIVNWQVGTLNSETVLTLLVLREPSVEADGEFGTADVVRYREFRLMWKVPPEHADAAAIEYDRIGVVTRPAVMWRKWREEQATGEGVKSTDRQWVLEGWGWVHAWDGKAYGEIPFALAYGQVPEAPLVCRPPLEALARRNLDYYRVENDHNFCMTLTHAPMLELIGMKPNQDGSMPKIRVSPARYYHFQAGQDSGMNWKAAPSDALERSALTMERYKADMATLSLIFLLLTPRGAETATARRLTAQAGFASLALVGHGQKDGLDRTVRLHCKYLRDVRPAPVAVHTEFDVEHMDPQTAGVIAQMIREKGVTRATGLRALKKGRIFDEEMDPDEEDALLEAIEERARELAAELQARGRDTGPEETDDVTPPARSRGRGAGRQRQRRAARDRAGDREELTGAATRGGGGADA